MYLEDSELEWKTIMQLPFKYTKIAKLQLLQFRINHHILTINTFLFKIGLKDNKLCNFCENHEETIYHILLECLNVQDLLKRFVEFCHTKEIIVPLNPLSFIF
jgi:hypothetical protein